MKNVCGGIQPFIPEDFSKWPFINNVDVSREYSSSPANVKAHTKNEKCGVGCEQSEV